MMGAIDNLVKGAAGQAVQILWILWDARTSRESEGLELVPMFPLRCYGFHCARGRGGQKVKPNGKRQRR